MLTRTEKEEEEDDEDDEKEGGEGLVEVRLVRHYCQAPKSVPCA